MSTMSNINERALVEFTKKLIQIPSPSGLEAVISKCIADEMTQVGFDQILIDNKYNVLGILEGQGHGQDLLYLAHSDHADTGRMKDPYSGKEMDGSEFGVPGPVIATPGSCAGSPAALLLTPRLVGR